MKTSIHYCFSVLKTSVSIGLVVLFSGCHDQDVSSPEIVQIHANGVISDDLHAHAGESNTFEVLVRDDHALKQMKFALISSTGIHHHAIEPGEPAHAFLDYNRGSWDTLVIRTIGGVEIAENFEFIAPDSVGGGWNISVAVIDEQGNLTSKNYSLHVENENYPLIAVGEVTPASDINGVFQLSTGSSLVLNGSIIDADSLVSARAEVYRSGAFSWSQDWTNINNWSFDLAQIILPPFSESGSYTIHLYAIDKLGWTAHVVASAVVQN